jgi:hypothetical protein
MKKIVTCLVILFLCINLGDTTKASNNSNLAHENSDSYGITMKQDLLCLMMAYPEYIHNVEHKADGSIYLIMKSGKKLLYDDKKTKNFEQKLASPDLQDMMEQKYPLGSVSKLMDKNFDPGRIRSYDILREVYGGSQKQVESRLKNVNLGYRSFQFNGNNKAAESLQNAIREIVPFAQKRQNISLCLFPCSGTFNYRLISGTNRLSPHSFGIAIDLARDKRDYWKWASPEEGEKRLVSYPKEIVEVFEKNNFVWGGKWSHFDILHFEYRPEIILKARYFGNRSSNLDLWYSGVPSEETDVKDYIKKINNALR